MGSPIYTLQWHCWSEMCLFQSSWKASIADSLLVIRKAILFPLGITSAEKKIIWGGIHYWWRAAHAWKWFGIQQLYINSTSKNAEKSQMCYCIAKPNINKQSLKIANIKQGNNLCFLLYSHPIRIVVLMRHLHYCSERCYSGHNAGFVTRDCLHGIVRQLWW